MIHDIGAIVTPNGAWISAPIVLDFRYSIILMFLHIGITAVHTKSAFIIL